MGFFHISTASGGHIREFEMKVIMVGMPLNQRHIDELKEIYHKHTGDSLSNQDAWDMARRLIGLFRLLLNNKHNNEKQ